MRRRDGLPSGSANRRARGGQDRFTGCSTSTRQSAASAANRDHPLDIDLIIVDEVSMVDVTLMKPAAPGRSRPGRAWSWSATADQLPSVGAGSVLADVIDSGAVPVARLVEIHRQAGSSYIHPCSPRCQPRQGA